MFGLLLMTLFACNPPKTAEPQAPEPIVYPWTECSNELQSHACNFEATTIDGFAELYDYYQRPIVLDLSTMWCGYCQVEVNEIQDWIDNGGDMGRVKMYSILTSVNSSQPNYPPDKWLDSEGWSFQSFTDNELSGVAQHFGIRGFPFWVLIDSNGDIVTRLSGSYTKDQFEIILSNLENYDKEN